MIARIVPHVPESGPNRSSSERVVGELIDDRDVPDSKARPVRVVRDVARISNTSLPLQTDGRSLRTAKGVFVRASSPSRTLTLTSSARGRALVAGSSRSAMSLGIFGSARRSFGVLDLYIAPHRNGEPAL